MQRIIAHSYPNRELRVTLCHQPCATSQNFSWEEKDSEDKDSLDPSLDIGSKLHEIVGVQTVRQKQLGVSPGYGGLPRDRKFSLYGKRMLQRCGGVADKEGTHQDRLFVTCTLPGSTTEAFEVIARWSAWLTDRLLKWLRYQCKDGEYMYVWEWQKRGALHWHGVIKCVDRSVDEWIEKAVKNQWQKLLDYVCKQTGIDVWRKNDRFTHAGNKSVLQCKVTRCERSIAGYLAKYLSKGPASSKPGRAGFFSPSRWYGICRRLLAKLRDSTQTGQVENLPNAEALSRYEDSLSLLQRYGIRCHEYRHEAGGGRTTVAYVDRNEQEDIWKILTLEVLMVPDSSLSGYEESYRLTSSGMNLMKRNSVWWRRYCRESSEYVKTLDMKFRCSQRLTPLEVIHLLEHLEYSLSWEIQVRLCPRSLEASWLQSTQEFLNRTYSAVRSRYSVCQ